MGERVVLEPLIYVVADAQWSSQLGEMPSLRFPQNKFLLIHTTITNSGGQRTSVPLLKLVNANGEEFKESEQGDGVKRWLGLLRELAPAETMEGYIVFDVPAANYKLRISENSDLEKQRLAFVEIPFQVEPGLGLPGVK